MVRDTENTGNRLSENGRRARNLRWEDTRVFLALARAGTLTGAARELGCGLATVSRQIERLEAALGFALFSRHQSGYRLTDDGAAMLDRAEAVERSIEAFTEGSEAQGTVAGRVRLATAETLATHCFIPRLPRLLDRYPGLEVEVQSDVGLVNLHRRDADLAVRMVEPERGHVVVQRIGRIGFGLYAAPDHVARLGAAASDLAAPGHRVVGWVDAHAQLPAEQWIVRTMPQAQVALRAGSVSAQLAAASAGLGAAVLPHFLARRQGLVRLEGDLGIDQDIWLAIHADLAHSRRVRAVADFAFETIRAERLEN
jgi:DNA-binding transcriptional LysR family regulator